MQRSRVMVLATLVSVSFCHAWAAFAEDRPREGYYSLRTLPSSPAPRTARLDDFARCLARKGATLYGASWCPNCRAQLEAFGNAADHLDYVECSESGTSIRTRVCREEDIGKFPTWEFRDGSRTGYLSLSRLSEKTGCALPASAVGPPAAGTGKEQRGGGAGDRQAPHR